MMRCIHAWIHGFSGRMGTEIRELMEVDHEHWDLLGGTALGQLVDLKHGREEKDWSQLGAYLEKVSLIIDFSAAPANSHLLGVLQQEQIKNKAILIGTTGLSAEQKSAWKKYASQHETRLLLAPNTSLGVLLTLKISELAGQVLSPLHFDIEILETHHRAKIDAPSGTAKFLAEGLAETLHKNLIYAREGKREPQEIGMASLRGGSVFGEHEVRFLGDNEEMTITHRALNRKLFAQGALLLSSWLLQKKTGFYRLEDISIEEMVQLLRKTRSTALPSS